MLLVIFMITTPLIYQTNIKVRLPVAKSGSQGEARESQINIVISNEGVVYLDDKVVTKKELKEKVSKSYQNNPELIVILRADKQVRFQDIVSVLDPLSELGITRMSIAVTKE